MSLEKKSGKIERNAGKFREFITRKSGENLNVFEPHFESCHHTILNSGHFAYMLRKHVILKNQKKNQHEISFLDLWSEPKTSMIILEAKRERNVGYIHINKINYHFLVGSSLHLNHLTSWHMKIPYWEFETLSIGIFLSNLDLRQLKTYEQFHENV